MISPVRKCTFQNIRIGARSIASSSISSLPPRSPLFNNPPLRNTFHQDEPEPLTTTKLRMIMFGKPGAGKGTLSSRLVKEFDILSLSTGDLLRQHIAERYVPGLPLGRGRNEIDIHPSPLLPPSVINYRILSHSLSVSSSLPITSRRNQRNK